MHDANEGNGGAFEQLGREAMEVLASHQSRLDGPRQMLRLKMPVFMFCLIILSGCSPGGARKDAVSHFQANQSSIEELAAYCCAHPGIDYVEFNEWGQVDLWVLDKENFDRKTSPARFKHELFHSPVNSTRVSNALGYAGVSMDTFSKMEELARLAGCISIEKPFWDHSPYEMEIGYRRVGWSKLKYRRYKDTEDVKRFISTPPFNNEHVEELSGKWTLVSEGR